MIRVLYSTVPALGRVQLARVFIHVSSADDDHLAALGRVTGGAAMSSGMREVAGGEGTPLSR